MIFTVEMIQGIDTKYCFQISFCCCPARMVGAWILKSSQCNHHCGISLTVVTPKPNNILHTLKNQSTTLMMN